jgi:trehalose-phosphatase
MSSVPVSDPVELARLVADAPRPWLIASDVDGTLAEITPQPSQSRLAPGALEALLDLQEMNGVTVAVVSGRSMVELVEQFELPAHLQLVGSHGVEFDGSEARTDLESERLATLRGSFADIAAATPGAHVESKPFSVALHVRNADVEVGDDALRAATILADGLTGTTPHPGKRVLEVAVRRATKAAALDRLRTVTQPATAMFIGDDASDETGFESLLQQRADGCIDTVITVKVGEGPTRAEHRLAAPDDVVRFLAALVDRGGSTNR